MAVKGLDERREVYGGMARGGMDVHSRAGRCQFYYSSESGTGKVNLFGLFSVLLVQPWRRFSCAERRVG